MDHHKEMMGRRLISLSVQLYSATVLLNLGTWENQNSCPKYLFSKESQQECAMQVHRGDGVETLCDGEGEA